MTGSNKPDGRRKPRPGINTQRDRLVEAALLLFGQQGARATSVSDICASANVSRHTFYRCFVDRDALIRYIYELAARRPVETWILQNLPEPEAVSGWLEGAIDGVVDAVLAEQAMAQFLFVEYGDPSSPAHAIINEAFAAYASQLGRWLGIGDDPAATLYLKSLMTAAQSILLETIRTGLRPQTIADAKRALLHLVSGATGSQTGIGTALRKS